MSDSAATSLEFARHVIAEIDTDGRPGIYALAEEYLRARRTIDALLPASGVMNVDEAIAEWGDFEEGTGCAMREGEVAAPVLSLEAPSKKPLLWHIMAERDGLVTLCGVRFSPDKPSYYGHTPDGRRGVDCVVCSDLYQQGERIRGY